ncbi:MAG: hypothetical protein PHQ43_10090 [Dehalococcoidales bacterium]|nr:hypothetical protein [Dehalococcoidales bacterium]
MIPILFAAGQTVKIKMMCSEHGDIEITVKPREEGMSFDGLRCPFLHSNQEVTQISVQIGNWKARLNLQAGHGHILWSCTEGEPCCDRRGEYNGFGSGQLKFVCPKHCPCHD